MQSTAAVSVLSESVAPTGSVAPTDGAAGALQPASALRRADGGTDAFRVLPVPAPLRPLFPEGGMRRGSTVTVACGDAAGARSLMLALLGGVSGDGGWGAVVAMPELSAWAASQAGVELARLAFVPQPGPEWSAVVAALLDGVDVVVLATGTEPVPSRVASRLAARARQRQAVLLVVGAWERPDLRLATGAGVWHGLGPGRGRLRRRELTVTASGRGAAARSRRVEVTLPDPQGRVATSAAESAGSAAAAESVDGRPALTVVDGSVA